MVEPKGIYLSLEAWVSLLHTSEQNQKSLHDHACENGEAKQGGLVSSQTFWELRPGKLLGVAWSVSHMLDT